MNITYETDIIAWANQQAQLLRAGLFAQLDIAHIAEEIEDVGKSAKRELRHRMALLLAHLLKWQYQPNRRGSSWSRTIKAQRQEITECLSDTPSLKTDFNQPGWLDKAWADAARIAENETGLLNQFPEACPWRLDQIMNAEFWPDA